MQVLQLTTTSSAMRARPPQQPLRQPLCPLPRPVARTARALRHVLPLAPARRVTRSAAAVESGEPSREAAPSGRPVQLLAPLILAVARMLPVITFALFGIYFTKSNLAVGLASAYQTSDVFVTAVLALIGWATTRFLGSVDDRLNAMTKRLNAIDDTLQDLKRTTKAELSSLKRLLEARRGS